MKPLFILLVTHFFILTFWEHTDKDIVRPESESAGWITEKLVHVDSLQTIRFINTSSLKRLPGVISDLSKIFSGTIFQKGLPLGKGFAIYLYDVSCDNVENGAAVRYQVNDTIYHLKLNRFNRMATDKALAATLIHEIMHCVLLDINRRARQEERAAQVSILNFGLNKNDSSIFFNNEFFILMNKGESGQHELMYQLFYPQMVALLKSFVSIHKKTYLARGEAENLMWAGLQQTDSYKKLSDEEKKEIELTIFKAKGIPINQE